MLPALPASAFRFLCRSALLVPALLLVAAAAYALDADLSAPRVTSGSLCLDVSLSDVLPDPVENSLGRGMPATLLVHAELWRHRSLWFDRMERSADIAVRVRYEVWNDSYRMERTGASPRSVATLDSVRALLERPMPVKLGPLETLQEDARYFVVVTVTLAPLSVEDVQEVEGWLSGEVESKRHSGFGVFTELPRALFDTVRNFAGFGDRHARAQSPSFVPRALPESP